ncbi:MAG: adenylate/guanylate cyclase domain-containing protein [Planctomycetota bacterium JB042]
MRYRTKVLASFVGLALVSNALLLVVDYALSSRQLRHRIESQVLSIAAAGAVAVDGDLLATLGSAADQESETYRELERHLRAVRDANRRPDVHVKYVYTLHRDAADPTVVRFGVDAEEPGPDKSNLGDVYETPEAFVFNEDAPLVFPEFSTDKWGTWVTAQAPIRDREGRFVALLGVDVAATDVIAAERRLLISGLLSVLAALALAFLVASLLSRRVARPLAALRDAVHAIGEGRFDTTVETRGKDEFAEVGRAVNRMAVGLLQRENLKGALARYVSKDVTRDVLSGVEVRLKGERRRVTILFADLRGFTSLAEKAPPEDVVTMLNDFYARMIESVMAQQGLINKFLGDGLMAMFGAPRRDLRQETHAIRAAFSMQRAMADLRARWGEGGGGERAASMHMGIGIDAGEAVVGNVGSDERIEYTAIGDTVNTASRLEQETKHLDGVEVIVSRTVRDAAADRFRFRAVGSLAIRGKEESVEAFVPEEPSAG